MRTAADPDLRAAGHTLPQVGRLPLFNVVSTSVVWLAAAEVGCSAALTSGCPSRAPVRLRLRLSGRLAPRAEAAESQRASNRERGIRVAVVVTARHPSRCGVVFPGP